MRNTDSLFVRKVLNIFTWKADNYYKWKAIQDSRDQPEEPAEIINLAKYREEIGEDKRWVRHYLWYSEMFFQARRRRLARMRRTNNVRTNPRR